MGKIRNLNEYDQGPSRERGKQKKKKVFESEPRHHIEFAPKTDNQKLAWKYFKEKDIIVLTGSAGVGKTMLATAHACIGLARGDYERLIITRNAIGCGKSVGFFPGTAEEKLGYWLQQVLSFCRRFVGKGTVDTWMKGIDPKIVLEPTEVIRGRSYENSCIIVEEAQQLSIDEIKCLTTRIGQNSTMILTGDPRQTDLKTDGLDKFCDLVERHRISGVGVVKFTTDDILRNDIVRDLVIAFQEEGL